MPVLCLFLCALWLSAAAAVDGSTTLNVRTFGAVGDGVTNDAPAIQAAFNAASDGDTIYLPAGVYLLATSAGSFPQYPDGSWIASALINPHNDITLMGDGALASTLKLAPAVKMRVLTSTGTDLHYQHFGIDGNKSARDGSVGWPGGDVVDALLYFKETARVQVSQCDIRQGIEDAIGFWMGTDASVTSCVLSDNGTSVAGGIGIAFSGLQRGAALQNTVLRNTFGISAAYSADDLEIADNTIQDNFGAGIIGGDIFGLGSGASHLQITNNTIRGNSAIGFAAIYVVGASDSQIDGNQVVDNRSEAIHISSSAAVPSLNWTVTNNRSSDTRKPKHQRTQTVGIRVRGDTSASLVGNTTENNGTSLAAQIIVEPPALVNPDWQTVNTRSYK